jgi:hypothetical protein
MVSKRPKKEFQMENLVPPPNPGGVDTKKKTCTLRKNEAK